MAARTSFSELLGMRPDPDILIGGAMSELHRVGILVEVLGYRLHQNLMICSDRHGHRRHRNRDIGIAQESRVAAMDLEIRCLLAIAVAELSAMRHAAELADLPVLLLVHLSVVIPPDYEQTSVSIMFLNILGSFLIVCGVLPSDYLLAPNPLAGYCISCRSHYLDAC